MTTSSYISGNETSHKPSLLIVEDDPAIQLLLTHTLERRYRLETARSFDEALQKADQHQFDALVLDIGLSDTRTGVDLLGALRQRPDYRHVPALACTAFSFLNNSSHYREAGFDEVVTKPFAPASITAVIEQMLTDETLGRS